MLVKGATEVVITSRVGRGSVTIVGPSGVIYSSSPGQNDRHFTDDIFKRIFLNENVRIAIQFSLKFVPKGLIGNKSALVQVMACRLFCAKPLPEPMLTQFTDAYMRH